MTTFTHTRTLEIAWGDCDPAGIVYHPRYFEWFDAAAIALFRAATGQRKSDMTAHYGIIGIPVVEASATFHLPCRYGDMVSITTQVVEWKRSSFRVLHELRLDGALAVTGRSTRVWTGRDPNDPARMRAVPLPPDLVALFDKKLEETP